MVPVLARWFRRITWLHITRTAGLIGLGYEVTVERVDKPSVMIVIGAMILGTESLARIRSGKGGE